MVSRVIGAPLRHARVGASVAENRMSPPPTIRTVLLLRYEWAALV
jgi:hypothetical protein